MVLQNHLCVQEKETRSAAWVGAHVATFCDLWDMYSPPEEILENTIKSRRTLSFLGRSFLYPTFRPIFSKKNVSLPSLFTLFTKRI